MCGAPSQWEEHHIVIKAKRLALRPEIIGYCVRREESQPPPPVAGARAATGPTIRSKSAFGPGLPWIGTCWATSSLSRLMLRNNATALGFTFAIFPPAAGGPYRSALIMIFSLGRYTIAMLSLWLRPSTW